VQETTPTLTEASEYDKTIRY